MQLVREMVSPQKPTNMVRGRRAPFKELSELHFKHHAERAAWRVQLEALRSTLEVLQETGDIETTTPNESALSFLRERFQDVEDRLDEERQRYAIMTSSFQRQVEERDAVIRKLEIELKMEREGKNLAIRRLGSLLSAVNKAGHRIAARSVVESVVS